MKKFITLALALCMALSASICASAAEVNTDGGSGSTPVYLSSTEDGTLDGDPSATAMSVTVPTALPMAMSQTGDVTTADNCQIINNSYGVRPFLSDKYDITKHPNYKYLSDADEKNTFDIEKFLSTKLKTKSNDTYDVYEIPESADT